MMNITVKLYNDKCLGPSDVEKAYFIPLSFDQ